MSTFTMPLWKVIEITGGTVSRNEAGVRLMEGGDIGLGYFTCFEPAHKTELVGKIIDHYWNQEIGMETISMFQLAMTRRMNEIMPYYNQLYKTETLVFDPLSTIKLHTIATGNEVQNVGIETTAENISANTSGSRTVQSELPQVALGGNNDYATAAVDANSAANGTTNGTETKESDSTTDNTNETTVEGYQAYPSRLIQQYRDILINIDTAIIAELSECFMGIWNTGDDYNPYPSRFPSFF